MLFCRIFLFVQSFSPFFFSKFLYYFPACVCISVIKMAYICDTQLDSRDGCLFCNTKIVQTQTLTLTKRSEKRCCDRSPNKYYSHTPAPPPLQPIQQTIGYPTPLKPAWLPACLSVRATTCLHLLSSVILLLLEKYWLALT